MNFLCHEALCFDVSERKFVCQEKRSRGTLWKQDQRYEWVPHTFHPREIQQQNSVSLGPDLCFHSPRWLLDGLAIAPPNAWPLPWSRSSISQADLGSGALWEHPQLSKLSRYPRESLFFTWSHWAFRNGSISWATGNDSQLNYHPTWTVAFQRPSEVQSCIVSWSQPLDKHIWTSSRSCS